MKKLRFALFGNVYQARKSAPLQELLRLLEERGAETLMDRPFHDFLTDTLHLSVRSGGLIEGNDFAADYVISMGGDGTFLEAASRVGDKGAPMLGVNMGRLGFLADVGPEEMAQAVENIYQGRCTVEPHSVLRLCYDKGQPQGYPCALNEVAVMKRDNSSMISVRVDVDGEYLATYQADGLIVCTPTGSTGYALSAGGPIMPPSCGTIGLVAVAPHSLNVRPITLPDNVEVGMTVESRNHQFLVSVDGRSETCHQGVRLSVRRAPYDIMVLKRPGSSFFRTLRGKLMMGSDVRVDNALEG